MAELILELINLDCPVCAKKIEDQVGKLKEVDRASLDFMTRRLKIEAKEGSGPDLHQKVSKLVAAVEPGVVVTMRQGKKRASGDEPAHEKGDQKRQLIQIIAGAAFYLAAYLCPQGSILRTVLFAMSYLTTGAEVMLRAVKNIFHGLVFDENLLMSIATAGAFLIGEFPEGAAVMLFYQVGEFFQSYAVNRSRKSIADLMDIKPEFAHVKREGQIITLSPEEVSLGETIIVKPGEKIPLDGIIKEGKSALDTSALTGEPLPADVGEGDMVQSGCINKTGVISVEVTREFYESTVMKILEMVENAGEKKAQTENFITRFARVYTPVVVLAAAALAVVPPLLLPGADFSDWIYRGLIFLVISCPCALVISVPLSFFAGIGMASRQGVLIKGSNFIEGLAKVKVAVFDKTGTLTKGNFEVDEIVPNNIDKNKLLEYAALAQSFSNHPISRAIRRAYPKEIDASKLEDAQELAGLGVSVSSGGERLIAGNAALMEQEKIAYTPAASVSTAVYVAKGGEYLGYLTVADEIKADAKEAVLALKNSGVTRVVMLTGDKSSAAEAVGKQLGIGEAYAQLLPQDKLAKIEELLSQKPKDGTLLFAGDGINDAPSLIRADIGVSMGMIGSDAATDAADVVIMTDEPSKIVTAVMTARRTLQIVKQNIVFTLAVKFAVLLLGAVGLATMWSAVFADVGVSVLAVLNAMRIFLDQKNRARV